MNKQETLEKLYDALKHDTNPEFASCYGLTKVGDEVDFIKLRSDRDIYDLIASIDADKLQHNYEYITLITYGWAAPINENGEVDGLPSQHPEKRRVRLTITADVNNKEILGSAMQLAGDEEILYDFNTATGMLADAVLSIVS